MSEVSEAVLVADDLTKVYGRRRAVDGVTLRLGAGEVHGLLGPNGAGKSTFLRLLLGLVAPDAGALHVCGRAGGGGPDVAGFAGSPRFWPYLTARHTLSLLSDLDGGRGRGRIAELLALVGLQQRADDRVGTFSTGMRQRLGLAAALLREPRLLLLDEPATGLDPAGARDLRDLLRTLSGQGTAVLLSSHDLAGVSDVCDAVTVLRTGRTVWTGPLSEFGGGSSAALTTSDDALAFRLAARSEGILLEQTPAGLRLQGEQAAVDALVLHLAAGGVAVRTLVPVQDRLEAEFLRLTGGAA